MRRWLASLAAAVLFLAAAPAPGLAQEAPQPDAASVGLSTRWVTIATKPGDTASFDLDLAAPPGERIQVAVSDAPEGWKTTIRGGGHVVKEVMVPPDQTLRLQVEVEVPASAPLGEQTVTVTAKAPSGTASLLLGVDVDVAASGGVALTTDFPALRGPADVKFSYDLKLSNDTPAEIQFGLDAQAPPGWVVDVRPSGERRASTITLGPGDSTRITAEVDPPDATTAGSYPVVVRAVGGGQEASIELTTEITGNFSIGIAPPDQRLNAEVATGGTTDLPLVVTNLGSAELDDIALSDVSPQNWKVTFTPDHIARLGPGESADVTATIEPAPDAIAGDYVVTLRARTQETNDSTDIRVTVSTSRVWGLVGIGIILLAVIGLAVVFRRFGRR